ncbi:MAG: MoaD/ThiS family protein [DPANN group archaeon]|nr:MoaD/ThiS family protein [DPANN group archaeon]
MFVFILNDNKKIKVELNADSTILKALESLGISPSTVITKIDNTIVPLETILSGDETIKVFRIISGG